MWRHPPSKTAEFKWDVKNVTDWYFGGMVQCLFWVGFGFFPACINCIIETGSRKHVIHEQIDIARLLCILLSEKKQPFWF